MKNFFSNLFSLIILMSFLCPLVSQADKIVKYYGSDLYYISINELEEKLHDSLNYFQQEYSLAKTENYVEITDMIPLETYFNRHGFDMDDGVFFHPESSFGHLVYWFAYSLNKFGDFFDWVFWKEDTLSKYYYIHREGRLITLKEGEQTHISFDVQFNKKYYKGILGTGFMAPTGFYFAFDSCWAGSEESIKTWDKLAIAFRHGLDRLLPDEFAFIHIPSKKGPVPGKLDPYRPIYPRLK